MITDALEPPLSAGGGSGSFSRLAALCRAVRLLAASGAGSTRQGWSDGCTATKLLQEFEAAGERELLRPSAETAQTELLVDASLALIHGFPRRPLVLRSLRPCVLLALCRLQQQSKNSDFVVDRSVKSAEVPLFPLCGVEAITDVNGTDRRTALSHWNALGAMLARPLLERCVVCVCNGASSLFYGGGEGDGIGVGSSGSANGNEHTPESLLGAYVKASTHGPESFQLAMLTDLPVLFDTLTLCRQDGQSPHIKWLSLIHTGVEGLLRHGNEAIAVAAAVSTCVV